MEPVLGKMQTPPIQEVLASVTFEEQKSIDPVIVGHYWSTLQNQFPMREFRPRLASNYNKEELLFLLPGQPIILPIRTLLFSSDDSRILQIQSSRFMLNWKKTLKGDYPRCRDTENSRGFLSEFISEFRNFSNFLKSEYGWDLKLKEVFLAKIDIISKPILEKYSFNEIINCIQITKLDKLESIGLRSDFHFSYAGGGAIANIELGTEGIKIDSNIVYGLVDDDHLEKNLSEMNNILNLMFKQIVNREIRLHEFGEINAT